MHSQRRRTAQTVSVLVQDANSAVYRRSEDPAKGMSHLPKKLALLSRCISSVLLGIASARQNLHCLNYLSFDYMSLANMHALVTSKSSLIV